MKVAIVNCFETFEERVDLVKDYFLEKGFEVTVVQSDFNHFKKTFRKEEKKDFLFVKTLPYQKNLSLSRLYSHYKFSKDAFTVIKKIKPDLLYSLVPPNSLAKFSSNYKKKNKHLKLILDIIDLWPETIPIGFFKKNYLFKMWGSIRNRSLNKANLIITECDFFQIVLKKTLKNIHTKTLYQSKREINVISKNNFIEDCINLAYLGSINNIIDIPKIIEIMKTIMKYKPVVLHIIGDGEKRSELIESSKNIGVNVEFHGIIYDAQRKQDIFDKCHFGLNIMKKSVCVGLTMKSIDYFQHGLPIINNISGDTKKLIDQYNVGINVIDDLMLLSKIIKTFKNTEVIEMKIKAFNLFNEKFSSRSFSLEINSIMLSMFL